MTSQVALFLLFDFFVGLFLLALTAHHTDQAFMQDVVAKHFGVPWREISPYGNSVTAAALLFCTSSLMVNR